MKIHYLTFDYDQGSSSHSCPVPSTSCDLFRYEIATVKLELHLQENTSWGQGHMKCCPVPQASTSCDIIRYKIQSCYL